MFSARQLIYRVWLRTSRGTQWPRQSWCQGRVRKSLQSWRWSPAKSFLELSRTLRDKKEGKVDHKDDDQFLFTECCRVSKEKIDNSNVLFVGVVHLVSLFTKKVDIWYQSRRQKHLTSVREERSSSLALFKGYFRRIGPFSSLMYSASLFPA